MGSTTRPTIGAGSRTMPDSPPFVPVPGRCSARGVGRTRDAGQVADVGDDVGHLVVVQPVLRHLDTREPATTSAPGSVIARRRYSSSATTVVPSCNSTSEPYRPTHVGPTPPWPEDAVAAGAAVRSDHVLAALAGGGELGRPAAVGARRPASDAPPQLAIPSAAATSSGTAHRADATRRGRARPIPAKALTGIRSLGDGDSFPSLGGVRPRPRPSTRRPSKRQGRRAPATPVTGRSRPGSRVPRRPRRSADRAPA